MVKIFKSFTPTPPGILKPVYKLQESMLGFVNTALVDADILLYVTDVVEDFSKNADYLEKIKSARSSCFGFD